MNDSPHKPPIFIVSLDYNYSQSVYHGKLLEGRRIVEWEVLFKAVESCASVKNVILDY